VLPREKGVGRGRGTAAMCSALLNSAAGVDEGGGRWPHSGEELDVCGGTNAAVGWRGAIGTGPEPTCASGRRASMQNRGGGVAARGA
jgi:hypothetical protein